MILGLLAALASAVAYGVASVLQAVGSRRLALAAPDARLLLRLLTSLPYLAGLVLDGLGFVATVAALRVLPLFVVESAVASSVGVTALVAARFLGVRLRRSEWIALLVLGVGLVALAASAEAEGAAPLSRGGQWLVLALSAVVALLAALAARTPARRAAAPLAAAAGLGFAGVGIAARALPAPDVWWHLVTEPLTWALVLDGVIALVCYAAALQRGSVTIVAAITFAVETIVPAVVGYAVLGDRARPGFLPVAVVGLVLTLGAAIALARYSEPGH
jgi:drug/metabolite transporter (DMT)-like permease